MISPSLSIPRVLTLASLLALVLTPYGLSGSAMARGARQAPVRTAGHVVHADDTSPWTNIGPTGGQFFDLAVDPTSPTTVFAGNNVGLFKSTDGGSTWASTGSPGGSSAALAVDPSDDTTVYAASADGFWISTDGGSTWNQSNSGLPSSPVLTALAVDPSDGSTVFAGTNTHGIYESTDGGSSWTAANTGLGTSTGEWIKALAFGPSPYTTLWAATTGGPYVSTNSGGSWSLMSSGLPSGFYPSLIAVDPANGQNVWVGGNEGVYYSSDGGADWSADSTGFGVSNPADITFDALVVAGGTVYAAGSYSIGVTGSGTPLYSQAIGGSSWTQAATGMTDPDGSATAWVHALAADPADSSDLYAATDDGGMFKTTNGGASWSAANTDLLANGIQALQGSPTDENEIVVSTDKEGVFASHDGGTTWTPATGFDGYACGGSYSGTCPIGEIAVDPSNANNVWAGDDVGNIFKSTDGGLTWTETAAGQNGLPAEGDNVSGLAVDPSSSSTVYATFNGAGVYKTTDGGTSWTAMNSGLTNLNVSCMALDPTTEGTLYVGTYGSGVFASADGGGTWTQEPASGNGYISALVDPRPLLFRVDGDGLKYSYDKGRTWHLAAFHNADGESIAPPDSVEEPAVKDGYMWVVPTSSGVFFWVDSGPPGSGGEPQNKVVFVPARNQIAAYGGLNLGFGGEPEMYEGTSGNDLFALPSGAPLTSDSQTSSTTSGAATATIQEGDSPGDPGSLSATASDGTGTVTVDDYFADPESSAGPTGAGNYVDVKLSSGSTFTSVGIEDCQLAPGNEVLGWFNGTDWLKASDQSYDSSSGCATITVNSTTSPSLSQLTGTVFVDVPGPSASWLTKSSVTRKGSWLTVRWRVASNDGLAGFDLYAGSRRLDRRIVAVHRSLSYKVRVRYAGRARLSLHIVFTNGAADVVRLR